MSEECSLRVSLASLGMNKTIISQVAARMCKSLTIWSKSRQVFIIIMSISLTFSMLTCDMLKYPLECAPAGVHSSGHEDPFTR